MQIATDSEKSPSVVGTDFAEVSVVASQSAYPKYRIVLDRGVRRPLAVDQLYPGADNPFPWTIEMIDLNKERDSFEDRAIEYRRCAQWD